jgi:NADH dehydrogenase
MHGALSARGAIIIISSRARCRPDDVVIRPNTGTLHRIVVVGGGAGGLELATRLGDTLGRTGRADVTLVDAALIHVWKPLLHEIAAGTLSTAEEGLSYLAQGHWHGFGFRLGRVHAVDRAARRVLTEPTLDESGAEYVPARSIPYDTLVLAVGSVSNDFGIPGVAEHCFFLDAHRQADRFHQHLLRRCYAAHAQEGPLRPGQLHIAIVGAGATGVELAAELHRSTRDLVAYGFDRIDPERDLRITLIEAADRILPGLPERLSDLVLRQLREIGVEVLTGERIVEATAEGFRTGSGRTLHSEIKVWAAGIKAPGFLAGIDGLQTNRLNQVIVRSTLQAIGDDDVFAMGDCAACPMPPDGFVPPRAQAAHQQASLLYRGLRCRLRGEPLPVFRYVDYGSLINMSRYSTVGSLMGNVARLWSPSWFVEGTFARIVYLSLYKMHQFAVHGIIRTTLATIANLLTRRTRPRLKLH